VSAPEDLTTLTDAELQTWCEDAIHSDAVMCHSQWAKQYRDEVDRLYAECRRRERGIYQRAWNAVVRDQGHTSLVQPVTVPGA